MIKFWDFEIWANGTYAHLPNIGVPCPVIENSMPNSRFTLCLYRHRSWGRIPPSQKKVRSRSKSNHSQENLKSKEKSPQIQKGKTENTWSRYCSWNVKMIDNFCQRLFTKLFTLRYLLNTPACLIIFSFYIHGALLLHPARSTIISFYILACLTHPACLLKSHKWHKILPFSILKMQINQVWWSDIW